jgi:aspartate kinase
MAKGKVVIIGGFQGVSYKRDITTLGRGGSDTSAVALAAALDAERCEIYSDVDGVYSADPAVVANARHLPEISYPEMQEMSTAGAKVLNAHAVQFAKEKNIALYARSTFQPGRETIIRKMSPGKLLGVQAVVREEQIERIRISGQDVLQHFQQAASYLEIEQVPVKEVSLTHVAENGGLSRASFVVPASQIYDWKDIKTGLQNKFGPNLAFDTDLSAVSLIGEGLNRNNQTLLKTLELLAENNITAHAVTTTSFRISLLVPRGLVDQSVQLCHDYWIISKRADPNEGFEEPRVQGVK